MDIFLRCKIESQSRSIANRNVKMTMSPERFGRDSGGPERGSRTSGAGPFVSNRKLDYPRSSAELKRIGLSNLPGTFIASSHTVDCVTAYAS